MLHWFFCNEFADAQEQAPTQVPNYDKFVDAQLYMALFDNVANQRAPGQLQLDDCTRPSPWGSLKSSLSRRMPVRWHAAELTVKLGLTDRLLSPMRTYCVLGYLLLEPHWPPHPPSQRFIFVLCIAAHKRAELY